MPEALQNSTQSLFQSIGEVVVSFQLVEYQLALNLASLLAMQDSDDGHIVSAAMSYKQKVDLTLHLMPKRLASSKQKSEQEMLAIRTALNTAEEFRNWVVHSYWYVSTDELQWEQAKGNLRSKNGFKLKQRKACSTSLKNGIEALNTIREWYYAEAQRLEQASKALKSTLQEAEA